MFKIICGNFEDPPTNIGSCGADFVKSKQIRKTIPCSPPSSQTKKIIIILKTLSEEDLILGNLSSKLYLKNKNQLSVRSRNRGKIDPNSLKTLNCR
jgi:hypothetical protein